MLRRQLFQTIKNKKGLIGIRYDDTDVVLAMFAHSPYASARSRMFLELEILRAYNRYYKMVCKESMGKFLQHGDEIIKLKKEEF